MANKQNNVIADMEKKTSPEAARLADVEIENRRLKNALERLDDGFIIYDPDDRVVHCNEAFRKLHRGLGDSIVPGLQFEDGIRQGVNAGIFNIGDMAPEEFIAKAVKNRNENLESKGIVQFADGGYMKRLDYRMDDGYSVGLRIDFTETQTRELELEEARKKAESADLAKSEFLANMSHEIRTPMNGVMGMAELLADTELDLKQKMFADVILKSGASLLTIINDILDFSKIDAGQMELDPTRFELAPAVEDVATLVSSKAAEKDLELIVRIAPELPETFVGDVGRIRQILTNLVGNAVKFTEHGYVLINVSADQYSKDGKQIATLNFSVKDTGVGIPEEKCATVFEKFSQVDNSATRKHEGTGLGLSIASSLVEIMGGEMQLESQLGEGSTFSFSIDLPIAQSESNKAAKLKSISGAKILVVDDNHVNQSILLEQLRSWGVECSAVSSGHEALLFLETAYLSSVEVDAIILDYQMPEMSGEVVLEKIKSDECFCEIPVIMLTSVDGGKLNQRLTSLGSAMNLTKPTRSSLMQDTLIEALSNNKHRLNTFDQVEEDVPEIPEPEVVSEQQLSDQTHSPDDGYILVAEDNDVNQIVITQILNDSGARFKIASNGKLAVAEYLAERPKMIFMDVSMPEMDGKEATIEIRKYEQENGLKPVTIVALTAHALKGAREEFLEAGMNDYLSKPVSPRRVLEKIDFYFKGSDIQKIA